MQRGADEDRGLGVPVEQHVLPRYQHIIEDDERVDLVEPVGQGIVVPRGAARKSRAADELEPGRAEVANEAHRVVGIGGITPIGDRRLGKGLVGVGGGGFIFRAAYDDAGIRFLHDVQQHVGILVLRRFRAVAFGIGIGGDVKRIGVENPEDMIADVLRELRVDLVEHILPVEQRPHLADRLVADACHHAADVFEHRVGGPALVPPILLAQGKLVVDRMNLAVFLIGHQVARGRFMLQVVDAGPDIDQRLERRVHGDVLYPLAIDVNGATVPNGGFVFFTGPYHVRSCSNVSMPTR